MAEPVALAALVLEAGIGWPGALYRRIGHPVGGFARIIGWCERHWNAPSAPPTRRRLLGLATLLIVAGTSFGIALAATALVRFLMGDFAWIGLAVLAFPVSPSAACTIMWRRWRPRSRRATCRVPALRSP